MAFLSDEEIERALTALESIAESFVSIARALEPEQIEYTRPESQGGNTDLTGEASHK